ncbi:MAG TPA: DUF4332 domain-containing protein [Gammaproteobacteria bacterium]|nr:DUF4332 domain-containing protein [Gammaproteobacteria bacterium]
MGYLIGQILLCLLIAFALGFIIGCLFCRSRGAAADAPDWAGRYERLKGDYSRLQSESEEWKAKYTALAAAPPAEAESEDWAERFEQLKQDYDRLRGEADDLQRQRDEWKAKHDALLAGGGVTATTHEYREGLVGDDYPYPVEEVEGIGKGFGKKLRALGIETTEDLLQRCCTRQGWEEVADKIGLKERYVVRKWASMSDLMRITGIMGQYAELLEFSDVNSVQDLASRDPAQLLEKLKDVNQREHRVKEVPSLEAVASWIEQAKTLDAVMKI